MRKRTKSKKPIIYIGGPGYSYEHFEPLVSQIGAHFDAILRTLKATRPDGKTTHIELFVEASGDPDAVSAKAKRVCEEPAVYEIRMTTGLSYHVWLASRALAGEYDFLPWFKQLKINDKSQRKIGRKELLADFAYFIGSYYILLHEISHVLLGHCDYVIDEMGFDTLDEFEEKSQGLSPDEIRIKKAFEAEADRQAGEFLSGFFESSLGRNGLGVHLTFPSRKHVYEFYVYAITLVFVLLQQLTQRKGEIHPKPNERQYIVLSSLTKYLEMNSPEQHDMLMQHVTMKAIEAGDKTGLIGSFDVLEVAKNALGLGFVDDVVKETGIRRYQHIVS